MTLPPTDSTTSANIIAEAIKHKDVWDKISSIGILLAGIGGLKILLDYTNIKKFGLTLKTQKLKWDYPIEKLGKTYYI